MISKCDVNSRAALIRSNVVHTYKTWFGNELEFVFKVFCFVYVVQRLFYCRARVTLNSTWKSFKRGKYIIIQQVCCLFQQLLLFRFLTFLKRNYTAHLTSDCYYTKMKCTVHFLFANEVRPSVVHIEVFQTNRTQFLLPNGPRPPLQVESVWLSLPIELCCTCIFLQQTAQKESLQNQSICISKESLPSLLFYTLLNSSALFRGQ